MGRKGSITAYNSKLQSLWGSQGRNFKQLVITCTVKSREKQMYNHSIAGSCSTQFLHSYTVQASCLGNAAAQSGLDVSNPDNLQRCTQAQVILGYGKLKSSPLQLHWDGVLQDRRLRGFPQNIYASASYPPPPTAPMLLTHAVCHRR